MIKDPIRNFAFRLAVDHGRLDLVNQIEGGLETLERRELQALAKMMRQKKEFEQEKEKSQIEFLSRSLNGIRFALVRGLWALTQAQCSGEIGIDLFDLESNREEESEEFASVGAQKMLIGQFVTRHKRSLE